MKGEKRNSIHRAYKRLLTHDQDWDYGYLLSLEKNKMQRMAAYFAKSKIAVGDENVARDLTLCIKLIDIILEEDVLFSNWLTEHCKDSIMHSRKNEDGKTYSLEFERIRPATDFPKYINVRNEYRFLRRNDIAELEKDNRDAEEKRDMIIMHKVDLRIQKALHLYNMIREYRMFNWWN